MLDCKKKSEKTKRLAAMAAKQKTFCEFNFYTHYLNYFKVFCFAAIAAGRFVFSDFFFSFFQVYFLNYYDQTH